MGERMCYTTDRVRDARGAQVVVQVGDREVTVEGRAAVMVAWLASNWQRVDSAERGQVAFDFAGTKVTPSVREVSRELLVQLETR